ncbi:MAG: oxidoreductase [Pirellulaceae bacterium]|nr:MAG: oxidoreductase [Pirellulaceae bacterium]
MSKVNPRVAVITGAGTGIGRASAVALAERGFTVVLAGRRPDALEATALQIGSSAPAPHVVPADVTDPRSVERLFDYVEQKLTRLDFLFNNAGINVAPAPLEEFSLEAWRQVLEVNVTGVFLCTQAAFRLMKKQHPMGGRILNNGSVSAQVPRPWAVAYTAAKHAVTGITKTAALEGRAYGIACGQLDIGNADTAMAQRARQGALQADGQVRSEPVMDVQHVAQLVAHIACLPPDTNVLSVTMLATQMPFVGRG